uniref:phosphoglucomutase (alpha-D-glucose-1,6-bisphosphate-dependent) n=1 Tax=Aceria tosichella TaxID=561515 RepID=A0A6G1SFN0_9ACAR
MDSSVIEISTQAYGDQKPGTSGLRKRVVVFKQSNYVENFIQAILEAAQKPASLVVGGDGRYYSEEAIGKIINVCAANGVGKIVVPVGGILSTPAASALIRSLKADGGIILTASHNPGGPDGDFGIKYNTSNGGPAPESITNKIYEISKSLTTYKSLLKRAQVKLDQTGSFEVGNGCTVTVVDPVDNYLSLMKEVFDFDQLKRLFNPDTSKANGNTPSPFVMLADPMNGVVGPYARRILIEQLGAPESSLINSKPLVDFGGKHPDPNLTYAKDLVDKVKADKVIKMGVAFDGDGDRNMILGQEAFFVTPGDSLAIIAANVDKIKYFKTNTPKGFARSFPTSPAVDRVAQKLGVNCYETPTGWKFFGNLMDSQLMSLCGEESFGTGSDHIREKDGLWACLAWLSIMAATGKTVKELVEDHWKNYGRDYFCRYDFEECDASRCQAMIKELENLLVPSETGSKSSSLVGKKYCDGKYEVKETGNFEYVDPVDKSVTSKQGLFIKFTNGARIIVRLSGTGSSGATVRLYVSDYSKDKLFEDSQTYLKDLLEIAYAISKLPEFTGREKPTVIT